MKGVGSYASKLNKKLTASITNKIENVSGQAVPCFCCAALPTPHLPHNSASHYFAQPHAPAQETVALTTKMGTKLDIIKNRE